MISSCCTFRLNRRSALSMDSPSCTFTSAKLEYTPFAADFILVLVPRSRRGDLQLSTGLLDPSEYVRLSQVLGDPRRKRPGFCSILKSFRPNHLEARCGS